MFFLAQSPSPQSTNPAKSMVPLSECDSCSQPCPSLWQLSESPCLNTVFYGIDGKTLSCISPCSEKPRNITPSQSLLEELSLRHLNSPSDHVYKLTLNWLKSETVSFCKFLIKNLKNRLFKGHGNATHVFMSRKKNPRNSIKLLYYIQRKNIIRMYIHHISGPHKIGN